MVSRIAFGIGEIARVLAGEQTLFLRPARGIFRVVHEGARLWLAEPFHLERRFDLFAPTAALAAGALPAFAADWLHDPLTLARTHGVRRPARCLCRAWHRAHLVITARHELRLHALGPRAVTGLGFGSTMALARHWDREIQGFGARSMRWEDNPSVLLFGFTLVRSPLDGGTGHLPGGRHSLSQEQRLPRAAPVPVRQPAITGPGILARSGACPPRPGPFGRVHPALRLDPNGTCPRCGSRLAFGCAHYPAQPQDHHHAFAPRSEGAAACKPGRQYD